MAVVGGATVVIRADTNLLRRDIQAAGKDIERELSISGDKGGTSFVDGIKRSVSTRLRDSIDTRGLGSQISRDFENIGKNAGHGFSDEVGRGAKDAFEGIKREAEGAGGDIVKRFSGFGGDAGNAFGASLSAGFGALFSPLSALLVLVPVLTSAITALVGALGALGAVAGEAAAGGLALLPGLIANAGIGIGVFKLAMDGVGGAVTALNKQSTNLSLGLTAGGKSATAAANAHEAAVRRVQNAIESLEHAEMSEKDALKGLTQAREDAREKIEALNFAVRGAAISEGQAQLAVQRAQENLSQINLNPGTTNSDRKAAELQLQSAILGLDEAKDKQKDLSEEKAKSDKQGVEGSDVVVAAKRRIIEAEEAERKAVQDLADARKKETQAAVTGANSVGNAVKRALADLSPEQRKLAEYLHSLKETFNSLNDAAARKFLPALQVALMRLFGTGGGKAPPFLAALRAGLEEAGKGLGVFVNGISSAFDKLARDGSLKLIFDGASKFFQALAPGINAFVQAFGHLAAASQPWLLRLATGLSKLFIRFNNFIVRVSGDGSLKRFFNSAFESANKLFAFFGAFGRLIAAVFGFQAVKAGKGLLDDMTHTLNEGTKWLRSPKGQAALHDFFQNAVKSAEKIFNGIGDIIVALGPLFNPKTSGHFFDQLKQVIQAIGEIAPPIINGLIKLFDILIHLVNLLINPLDTLKKTFSNFGFNGASGMNLLNSGLLALGATLVTGKIVKGLRDIGKGFKDVGQSSDIVQLMGKRLKEAKDLPIGHPDRLKRIRKAKRDLVEVDPLAQNKGARGLGSNVAHVVEKTKSVASKAVSVFKEGGKLEKIGKVVGPAIKGIGSALGFLISPVGLVIAGIALLVVGFILLYKHSKTFRDIVHTVVHALKIAAEFVIKVVVVAFQFLRHHLKLLLIALGPLGLAIFAVIFVFKHFSEIKKIVGDVISAVLGFFGDVISGIGSFIGSVVQFFVDLPGRILSTLGDWLIALGRFEIAVATWLKDKIFGLIGDVVDFFVKLPGRVLSTVGGWIIALGQFEIKVALFFRDKIRSLIGDVIGFFRDLPGNLLSFVTSIGSAAIKIGGAILSGIGRGLGAAGSFVVNLGKVLIDGLVSLINTIVVDPIDSALYNGLKSAPFVGGSIASAIGKHAIPEIPQPFPGAHLALGATVLPKPGGTLALLAEAGKAESVVDTGLMNKRLHDDKMNGAEMIAVLRMILKTLEHGHLGGITVEQLIAHAAPGEKAETSVPRALRHLAFELGS